MQRMFIAAAAAFVLPLAAQDIAPSDTTAGEEPVEVVPVAPSIIGKINDGTPPPPAPPKPQYTVAAKDVLSTTTQQQGGRTITFQKIKPIALPPPPEPPPAPDLTDEEANAFRERVAAYQAEHPASPILSLGATVYLFADSPPRTLVEYRPEPDGEPVKFWSSADFSLISGIHGFIDADGESHMLFMMWSTRDTAKLAAWCAKNGREYRPPTIPPLPAGPASFAVVGTPPAAEVLIPIQSLHDLYNKEYERLKTAYDGRVQAQAEREAYLKANPPQPKDITLRYWRIEKPATAQPAAQGGGQ